MADTAMAEDTYLGQGLLDASSLSGFRYKDGYTLSATDMGSRGVKIELRHTYDSAGAIILPPTKAQEYGKWLLSTLGQDQYGLPKELPEILERICRQKTPDGMLQRGDKKAIRDALKVLKNKR